MRKCPVCSEPCQEDEIKCSVCGKDLEPGLSKEEIVIKRSQYNSLAMWCHLSTFAGILVPFGNFIAPLIIWLSKKDEDPLVDDQGRESLNFQISVLIYGIAGWILVFVLVGIVFLVVLGLFTIIQVIKASLAASNGNKYRYPFCIRFIT